MITYSEAQSMMRTARNGRRKLQNNTYLHNGHSNGYLGANFAIRLHATDIITIHADGNFTLNTGGWETVTTKDRLNGFGPARVYSVDGTWCVISSSDPKTAPNVKKCRACKGTGVKHSPASYRYWDYSDYNNPRKLNPPEEIWPASDHECWRCEGTGQRDYGSKSRPVIFYDGIRVNASGEVIDPDAERMYPTREELDARDARIKAEQERYMAELARKQRAARIEWFKQCKPYGNGYVIVYKAVNDELYSGHHFRYPIGETVECDDWAAHDGCGNGLHFCARVEDSRRYFPSATRYLACAVLKRDAVVIGAAYGADKIKVKRARVLYEVNQNGDKL